MRAVVAGETGFVGRALASSLVADGRSVVVVTRSPGAAGRTGPDPVLRS